ncbi:MAG: MFS transporter [Candidatus Omnitrophota bacterium]
MSRFRETLKNRNFFLLWLGQIISQLGDRLGLMALLNFAYQKRDYGSPIEIFKILSFTIIPVFLIGPVAGVYVDRWDRRRTMYLCDFLRMLLVLAIPFFLFYHMNLAVAYFLIFLLFCLGRFFIPAKLSIIPDLVEQKDLVIANSLVNITGMIAAILGFGISGILVEKVGAKNGFYLDALSFFVSGSLIFFISKKTAQEMSLKKVGKEIVEVIKKSVIREIKDGVVYFIQKKGIGFTAGILFALSSAMGVVSLVLIAFVQNTLGSATKDLGFLIMFLGTGLFMGTIIYGRFGQRINQYTAIFIALFCTGGIISAFALGLERYPSFNLAALLSFSLGFLFSPVMIAVNTIIHKVSDNEMMGKIFSSIEIVMHLGFLLFMFISSLLAERFPQQYILVSVGVLVSLLGVISFIYKRKISWLN